MSGSLRWNDQRKQWQVDITIKGRRIRKLVGERREIANVVLDEYRRRRTLANHGLPVWIGGSALTLGEYSEDYKARLRSAGLSPRTVELRENMLRRHILPGLKDTPIALLDRRSLQGYFDARAKNGAGSGSLRNEHDLLRHLLGTAKLDGVIPEIPEMPRRPKPPPRKDRLLSADEVAQLLVIVKDDPGLERFTWIALWTGLRISEVIRLRWRDIDFKARTIYVSRTKTGKPLTVHLTKPLRAFLWKIRSRLQDRVIPSQCKDKRLEKNRLGMKMRRRAHKAGMGTITPHLLRHSVGSYVAAKSGVVVARDVLAHSSVTMTDKYLHAAPEAQREALEGLPWPSATQRQHLRPVNE